MHAILHCSVPDFIECLESAGGNLYRHPATFLRHPDTLLLQVREEPTPGLVIGVRDVIAIHHADTGQLTTTSHD